MPAWPIRHARAHRDIEGYPANMAASGQDADYFRRIGEIKRESHGGTFVTSSID
jgi:hypothetical protein